MIKKAKIHAVINLAMMAGVVAMAMLYLAGRLGIFWIGLILTGVWIAWSLVKLEEAADKILEG